MTMTVETIRKKFPVVKMLRNLAVSILTKRKVKKKNSMFNILIAQKAE